MKDSGVSVSRELLSNPQVAGIGLTSESHADSSADEPVFDLETALLTL